MLKEHAFRPALVRDGSYRCVRMPTDRSMIQGAWHLATVCLVVSGTEREPRPRAVLRIAPERVVRLLSGVFRRAHNSDTSQQSPDNYAA